MRVTACMACGSRRLRWARASEGRVGLGHEGPDSVCRDCQNKGPPVEFADEADWHAFASGLEKVREAQAATGTGSAAGPSQTASLTPRWPPTSRAED